LAQHWTLSSTSNGFQLQNAAFLRMCLVHTPDGSRTIELLTCDDTERCNSWSVQ
jgi:hypothetical protein